MFTFGPKCNTCEQIQEFAIVRNVQLVKTSSIVDLRSVKNDEGLGLNFSTRWW